MKGYIADDGVAISGHNDPTFGKSCNFDDSFLLIPWFAKCIQLRMHRKTLELSGRDRAFHDNFVIAIGQGMADIRFFMFHYCRLLCSFHSLITKK
ncbi:hypothetical protein D3C78_814060 [compost metagenome]